LNNFEASFYNAAKINFSQAKILHSKI